MDKTIADARENGYETGMGRRRYINDINSSNAAVRGYAERNAINAPIQDRCRYDQNRNDSYLQRIGN